MDHLSLGDEKVRGEMSFDILIEDETDRSVLEGCYRLPDGDWTVFIVTRRWHGSPDVDVAHVFFSGAIGVKVDHPKDKILTKRVVRDVLSTLLGVTAWREVIGPDSLTLK
jgi:hypothetical protein